MWVRRLFLANYRNYRHQEVDLPQGVTLLLGENAQGKSNLLEAVFLLATARAERAQTDGELICWEALAEPQPVARVEAEVVRRDGALQLDVIIVGRPKGGRRERVPASKRLRVNGVPRRQSDVIGQLLAVLFTTQDLELIRGPPAERRRFLDVTLAQLDSAYARALARYTKVMTQRNALLRRIQEGEARADELAFWDEELAHHGARLVRQRALAGQVLADYAREEHLRLSGDLEELALVYQPRLEGWDGERAAGASEDAIAAALRAACVAGRRHDLGAGLTLTGPHRDDLALTIDGAAATSFASRGQQRTAALSLRLAEARLMAARRGDRPVVLLDDVLSELDEARRRAVLRSLQGWDQLLITSADADRFAEDVPAAAVFRVVAGRLEV